MANLTPPTYTIPTAKLAVRSMLGAIVVHEVRDVRFRIEPWAQYASTLVVSFVPKGARKRRMVRLDYDPFCVVFTGETPKQTAMTEPESCGGVSVSRSRFLSCSPEWANEWRANFVAAVRAGKAQVEFDATGWNAHEPHGASVRPCCYCEACNAQEVRP